MHRLAFVWIAAGLACGGATTRTRPVDEEPASSPAATRRRDDRAEPLEHGCRADDARACLAAFDSMRAGGEEVTYSESDMCRTGEDCFVLGWVTLSGDPERHIARAPGRAILALLRSCGMGSARGCGKLGSLFMEGEVVDRDVGRGTRALGKACKLEPEAGRCAEYGMALMMGQRSATDLSRGMRLVETGCRQGSAHACRDAGVALQHGMHRMDGEPDRVAAGRYFDRACDLGDHETCRAGNAR